MPLFLFSPKRWSRVRAQEEAVLRQVEQQAARDDLLPNRSAVVRWGPVLALVGFTVLALLLRALGVT